MKAHGEMKIVLLSEVAPSVSLKGGKGITLTQVCFLDCFGVSELTSLATPLYFSLLFLE